LTLLRAEDVEGLLNCTGLPAARHDPTHATTTHKNFNLNLKYDFLRKILNCKKSSASATMK
jgi:hypothetical protein